MSKRNWRNSAAFGIFVLVFAVCAIWLTWWYASPQAPYVPRQEVAESPVGSYIPGGVGCDPAKLGALPSEKALSELERCAIASEEYRVRQAELREAALSNDLAEQNLLLTFGQSKIAFAQTIATALAFVAAAVAAVFAGLAARHAGASARADNIALKAMIRSAREARKDAAVQAERFSEQMEKSQELVAFTAKSANAMEHAATAMRRAGNAASRQADAAERALTSLERPFLVVEIVESGIEEAGGHTTYGATRYRFRNYGRSPAILTRRHFVLETGLEPPPPIDPKGPEGKKIVHGLIIGPGEGSQVYEAPRGLVLMSAIAARNEGRPRSAGGYIHFMGYVRYRDLMGGEYATGFCFIHNDGQFVIASPIEARMTEGDSYNYDRRLI